MVYNPFPAQARSRFPTRMIESRAPRLFEFFVSQGLSVSQAQPRAAPFPPG